MPGCKSNHGLQLDDAHRKAYIACEQNSQLVVFDLTALKTTQRLAIGDDPDVLAYDVGRSTLYVASESGTVSMLATSADGLTKIGEGFLGYAALETLTGRRQAAEIEPSSLTVIRRYELPGCQSSHSVAIDSEARAAYIVLAPIQN